jgi:hypothetical protein
MRTMQKAPGKADNPDHGPLPFFRQPLARLHPFDVMAIDIAGPYQIKIGRSMVKHWLLIFRCSTVGAIHSIK